MITTSKHLPTPEYLCDLNPEKCKNLCTVMDCRSDRYYGMEAGSFILHAENRVFMNLDLLKVSQDKEK